MRNTLSQRPDTEFTKGMLDAFVRIRGAEDVLRVAKRYGILDLCKHDEPIKYGRSMQCTPRDWSICRPRRWPDLCWERSKGGFGSFARLLRWSPSQRRSTRANVRTRFIGRTKWPGPTRSGSWIW